MNSTPDPTRDALSAAIIAHPDEDTPRLAYADHIEEHGDSPRAEFIRLQCKLATMNEWDDGCTAAEVRCRRLLTEHPEWLDPVRAFNDNLLRQAGSLQHHRGAGPHSVFVRGFPGVTAADAEWFARQYADLFATFPVRGAGFSMESAEARAALADCAGLARLAGLGISMWGEEREGFEVLARCKHLSDLKRLEVYSECLNADPLEALLRAPQFAALESFALRSDCGDYEPRKPEHVLPDLDADCWLFGLTELALDGNVFQGLGERLALARDWAPRLKRLSLRGYMGHYGDIAPEAVARVAKGLRSGWFAAVEDLDLAPCQFEGLVLDSLAESGAARPVRLTLPGRIRTGYQKGLEAKPGLLRRDWLSELRVLRLFGPSEADVGELLESQLPGRLRVLELTGKTLTGGRLRALLDVPGGWPHLERLNLIGNPLPDGALKEFVARADRFPRLVSFAVGDHRPAPKFLARLAESPAAAQLRELHLRIPLDNDTADALARSPHLTGIGMLRVHEGKADRAALDRLRVRFGPRITINDAIPF
jgi:uncharacterized protein (TIGR02996 family)